MPRKCALPQIFLLILMCCPLWLAASERINVTFRPGVTALEQTAILVHDGAATLRRHARRHSETINVSADSLAALRADPQVLHVEADHRVTCWLDPQSHAQGSGGTAGTESVEYISYGCLRIGGSPGTGMNTGTGVVIAIVDTGINLTHPDLQPNLIGNHNVINPLISANDDNGHGSHCAGIAAAAHNGVGVIGVAPDAKLLAVKVLDSNGSGWQSDVADGIEWAADNGAQVISLSLGGPGDSDLQSAVQYAASKNVVICCASGNSGAPVAPATSSVIYPAAYPECIAVSAWCDLDGTSSVVSGTDSWGDHDETLAAFSCTGPEIEFTAPGVYIYSDWLTTGRDPVTHQLNTGYMTESGTSMATPHVAGVAALNIKAGMSDIRAAIAARCEHVTGTASQVGAGLVRASSWVAPTVTISAPTDGSTVLDNATVTFTGTANDPQQGNISSAIHWSSSLDGALGTGASLNHLLSVGDHTITASVTNLFGQTASATRLIHVTPHILPAIVHAVDLQLVGPNQDLQTTVTIQDAAGHPLAGVSLTYFVYYNGVFWAYRNGVTGADGTYAYVHVGPQAGTLTAKVTALSGTDLSWNGSSPLGSVTKTASVLAVVHAVNLQLVGTNQDLKVTVTIQNNAGLPLNGVKITYFTYLNGANWTYRTGVTGVDGTYSYVHIGPQAGVLTAKVMVLSGPDMTWSGVSPVGSVTKSAAVVAVVQAINLQLVGANQDLQVTVTMQDSAGHPLAGAKVTYYVYCDGGFWTYHTGTTSASGIYSYLQLGPPAGTLTAKVMVVSGPNMTWGGSSPTATITRSASIVAVVHAVDLQLVGANQDLQVTVTMQDGAGQPLVGASITYYVYRDGVYWTYRNGVTGADGTYTYVHLGPQTGTLTAQVKIVSGPSMTWNGVSPVGTITKTAAILAVVHAVDLQLVGANQDLQTTVTVQDGSGNPLAGVNVTYYVYRNGVYWTYRSGVTGADGTYTYVNVGPQAGTLTAKVMVLSGPSMTWSGVSPVGTVTKTASITAVVHAVDLQLVGANQDLRVTVTIQDSVGNPLSGVKITYYTYLNGANWTYHTGITGADGTYAYVHTSAPSGTLSAKVGVLSGPDMTWSGTSPTGTIVK